ncbi:hypothetical protein [Deinococcus roseus]|uniref:DUF306 domain-containing protein n=1 Tax=Deinococcus roseus TaxID=392414 RepID=A0ABQ2DH01_9DEIO|nr:hypothetical protein [Deinococcus roseus]GGJ55183.1 hypothetical protein GCM10008938_46640 [Deinococcus roseus]
MTVSQQGSNLKSATYITWSMVGVPGQEVIHIVSAQRTASGLTGSCTTYRYLGMLQGSWVLGLTTTSVTVSSKDSSFSTFKDLHPGGKVLNNRAEGLQARSLCQLPGKSVLDTTVYLPGETRELSLLPPGTDMQFELNQEAGNLQVLPIYEPQQ